MSDLTPYSKQFEKIVNIIESAKERAYRKVNEKLILMYRDIGRWKSVTNGDTIELDESSENYVCM